MQPETTYNMAITDNAAPLRVLRLVNRFNLGGPTYNAAYLTKGLAPQYETTLAGGHPLPDEAHSGFIMQKLDVPYIEINEMRRSINPVNDMRALMRIIRMVRSVRPHIVHTHAAKAGVLGRLAAWYCRVPVVVHTYHGHVFSGYFSEWKTALVKAFERWLASRTTAVITISALQHHEIVDVHRICAPGKAHIIPLGFDLERFTVGQNEKRAHFRKQYELKESEIAIGIVGRFAPVKNHVLFFEALKLLDTQQPWKAFVIGDGDLRSRYEDDARTLGGRVIFTSWIEDMDVAMAGLDVVALTSINEGTPVSLIEAQAAAKPVVTTNAGGVRDCVLDGHSGIVVDDFEAKTFAAALTSLIEDERLRQRMGMEGRQHALHHFGQQQLVNDMKKLYEELLYNKPLSNR
ncbi:MAG: glycosyltransferase [Flavobacteriales bacterium]